VLLFIYSLLCAVDTSGATKDAAYIAELLVKAINLHGAEDVVCLITDSASVNVAAADLLKADFPKITWVRCGAHALNLLFAGMSLVGL
jgi:hypothetical protein